MKKKIALILSCALLILCAMCIVSCNGDDGVGGGHIHSYKYELAFGNEEGKFNLIGRCGVEGCDAPEIVDGSVFAYIASEKAPSCTEAGERVYSYVKDGQTLTLKRTLPATSHKVGDKSVEHYYIDSENNIAYGTEGFSLSSGEAVVCESVVSGYFTCTACNSVVSVKLKVLHDGEWYASETASASCTDGGVEYIDCNRCAKRVERESAPLGHLYSVEMSATGDNCFNISAACTRAGCSDEFVIENAYGVKAEAVKKASCAEKGIVEYTFVKDGISMSFKAYSEKLAHTLYGKTLDELNGANGNVPSSTLGVFTSSGNQVACGAVEDGYFSCDLCGEKVSVKIEKAHSKGSGTLTKAPDCTTPGEATYACASCGESFVEYTSPLGHLYADSADGDILKSGTVSGTFKLHGVCTRAGCGASINVDGVLALSATDKSSSCSELGERTYTYTYDGKRFTVYAVIKKLPHTLSGVSVDSLVGVGGAFDSDISGIIIDESVGVVSCGSVARGYYNCDVCSERVGVSVNVKPHHIEAEADWDVTSPTCKCEGVIVKECKYCDYEESEVLPAKAENHVFAWTIESFNEKKQSAVISGVCTEEGCGAEIAPSYPDADSYSFDVLGATCKTAGQVVHKWTVLGYPVSHTVSVDSFDHKVGGVFLRLVQVDGAIPVGTPGLSGSFDNLSCGQTSDDGMYKCAECSQFIPARVINPHAWEVVSDVLPTCDEGGRKEERCTRCTVEPKITTTAALGHSFVGEYNPYTKTVNVSCAREECDFTQIVTNAAPTLVEILSNPTCATAGSAKYYYEFLPDGEISKKPIFFVGEIAKLPHTIKDMNGQIVDADSLKDAKGRFDYLLPSITTSATLGACEATATGSYVCEGCSETVSVTVVRNHVHTVWQVVQSASCAAPGMEMSLCDVCGINGLVDREIPAIGAHVFAGGTYICDESGHRVKCKNCNVTTANEAHQYGSGVFVPSNSCTVPSKTNYTCAVCGYLHSVLNGEGGSHSFMYATIGTAPTFDSEGEAVLLCTTCMSGGTEIIPKIQLGVNATIKSESANGFTILYEHTLSNGQKIKVEIEIGF